MARIAGTFCGIYYTYYRDIIILMSGQQKTQNALIPNGVNPTDYEYQLTSVTTSGSLLTYGATNTWITLPVLNSFDQTLLLYSMEINLDESTPISSNTCWAQMTLTVRKKNNHLDYASGVIKLVPTLNVTPPPPPPPPLWEGKYTIGVITSAPGNNNGWVKVLKETFFNTDGTWSDTNTVNAGFNRSGRWIPAGANAANYSMRCREVTTQTTKSGSQDVNLNLSWQKMDTQRKVRVESLVYRPATAGNYETRWYGIIDIRNDVTGKVEYSGWWYTRAIVTIT